MIRAMPMAIFQASGICLVNLEVSIFFRISLTWAAGTITPENDPFTICTTNYISIMNFVRLGNGRCDSSRYKRILAPDVSARGFGEWQ